MKKLILSAFVALFLAGPVLAQAPKITSAWNYRRGFERAMRDGNMANAKSELEKARDAINEAVEHPSTKENPEAWMYRGNIYNDILTSSDAGIKQLAENPMHEAIVSYANVVKYDNSKRKKDAEQAQSMLYNLAVRAYNDGSNALNKGENEKSLKALEDYYLAYNNLGAMQQQLDAGFQQNQIKPHTAKLYMAYAAQNLEKRDLAIKYYEELVQANYNEPNLYIYLYDLYKKQGNDEKALAALDKGLTNETLTDKKNLLIEKLNYYIVKDEKEKALEYGKKALQEDPKNVSIYIAMGNIYEVLKMMDEADDMYKKAIALDPKSFKTNAAVGLNLYNKGVEQYNLSVNASKLDEINKYENNAKEIWKKAIPYLETAITLETQDAQDKMTMKDVYDSLAEMHAKLNNVEQANKYRKMYQEYKP